MRKTWTDAGREVWQRTAVLVILSLSLLLVGLVLHADLPRGSDLIFFNSWRGSWTDGLFRWGTRLGEEWGYIPLALILFIRQRRDWWWIPLTGGVVSLLSFLTKTIFKAPRPGAYADQPWFSEQLILVEGVRPLTGMTSFPSGHTMSAFALAVIVVYLFKWRGWGGVLALLLALLVAVSRMYLVLHFLEDVLLGAVLGLLIGWFLALLHQRYWSPSDGASASI